MGGLAEGDDLPQRLEWVKKMSWLFTSLAQDEIGQSDTRRQVHITAAAQAMREDTQTASKTQKRFDTVA
jgi:hypothetical protein